MYDIWVRARKRFIAARGNSLLLGEGLDRELIVAHRRAIDPYAKLAAVVDGSVRICLCRVIGPREQSQRSARMHHRGTPVAKRKREKDRFRVTWTARSGDSRFSWGCRIWRSQSPSGNSYPPADRSGPAWSGSECRRAGWPICRQRRAVRLWNRPAFWSSLSADLLLIPRRCTECPRPRNPGQRQRQPGTQQPTLIRDRWAVVKGLRRRKISGLAAEIGQRLSPAAFQVFLSLVPITLSAGIPSCTDCLLRLHLNNLKSYSFAPSILRRSRLCLKFYLPLRILRIITYNLLFTTYDVLWFRTERKEHTNDKKVFVFDGYYFSNKKIYVSLKFWFFTKAILPSWKSNQKRI